MSIRVIPRMKACRLYVVCYGALLLVASLAAFFVQTIRAADTSVDIVNFAFEPQTSIIAVGDTITWTNEDGTSHTATGIGNPFPAFDTGIIDPNTSRSIQFDEEGTFEYLCSIHSQMRGTVIVGEPTVNGQLYLPLITR